MGNCGSSTKRQEAQDSSDDKINNGTSSNEKDLIIVNKTKKTIGLRDREREVYGVLRYKIPPEEEQRVSVDLRDAGTYYRMAVLVMVDEKDENRVEPTHPPLFIDTEDLHLQRKITISSRDDKYVLDKEIRAQSKSTTKGNGSSKRT